jgi:hypothetical protein
MTPPDDQPAQLPAIVPPTALTATTDTELHDPGPQQIEPLAEAAPGTHCTLMKLTSRTCRWPIGDPKREDFCFCGGRTASFISGSHIMRRRNESYRAEAKSRTERQPSLNRAGDMLRPVACEAPCCKSGKSATATG